MPVGFLGGTPELWDPIHSAADAIVPDEVYFRSGPARAIRAALLGCVGSVPKQRVVELGCGGSRWLRILSQRCSAQVWGVDFSQPGVESTRRQLRDAGVSDANITLSEIHAFVERHSGMFDLVVSFGLVEHFYDISEILATHVRCARPGGRVFVTAPNLSALNLRWARVFASDILSWHRPISAADVALAFEHQRCTDVRCHYLGGPRLFVGPTKKGCPSPGVRTMARVACKAFNGAGEILYRVSPPLASRLAGPCLSPYFAVSATTPEG
jgi:2-polyprenyl-3-methyl-5-hydroxy-6-metoxy-1,4-benzoquinol methylase